MLRARPRGAAAVLGCCSIIRDPCYLGLGWAVPATSATPALFCPVLFKEKQLGEAVVPEELH